MVVGFMNNLRTPLSRVRLLGSAKDGTAKFIAQRVTALALIPLLLWFVSSVIFYIHKADHAALVSWIASAWNSELLILLLINLFYHTVIGLQEVIEDYVHSHYMKLFMIISIKFFFITIALASILAVLKMAV
jgi:succinate dehydrogenase / fumarate reductase membrane anchor subunit